MLSRLPWTPAPEVKPLPKPKRRMNHDRRRHFVELVSRIAKTAKDDGKAATLLNFEGPFRHGLRVRFIGEGWNWSEADDLASSIIATAFTRIGAQRPKWEEGQPEYSQQGAGALIERTRCVRCHTPLEGQQRKFCSALCSASHNQADIRRREADETRAYDLIANPTGRRA